MFIRKNKTIIIILQPVDGATDGATRPVICPASINNSYSAVEWYNSYCGGITGYFANKNIYSEIWKFRVFFDLKWNQNYFDIDQAYFTLTSGHSEWMNTLDIDLVRSYSTRHMRFGSTGITNGRLVAEIWYV